MARPELSGAGGRTRWRRVALVLAPAYALVAVILVLASTGVVGVSFAVSGTQLTVTASSLSSGATDGNGVGFYQYAVADYAGNGTQVQQVESIIPSATLTNLCQSVAVGPMTLRITAGDAGTPVTGTNLVVDASSLSAASAQFTNVSIGQDMGQFSNPALAGPASHSTGPNVHTGALPAGTFGQTAQSITITGLRQVASGTSASSFTLPNLRLSFGAAC